MMFKTHIKNIYRQYLEMQKFHLNRMMNRSMKLIRNMKTQKEKSSISKPFKKMKKAATSKKKVGKTAEQEKSEEEKLKSSRHVFKHPRDIVSISFREDSDALSSLIKKTTEFKTVHLIREQSH